MASESPNPANAETENPVTPEVAPAGAIEASVFPASPENAQAWLEKSEKSVKSVAENLRYGSWTKRFVTIGGVVFLAFNPMSVGKAAELVGVRELPKEYTSAFWLGMGVIGFGAVGAAIVTLPKRTLEAMPDRQAIKGLRSFELKDAEIFKRLERVRDVQEVLDAVDTADLRLFVLMGESGVGKSSLLQAGLMPNLGQVGFAGVYVKFTNREPLESIAKALKLDAAGSLVEMLRSAVGKTGKPIVLILDQFEQFFVQFQEEKRAEFIAELKAWYESDVAVKILIGIRGDLSYRLIELQQALGYSLGRSQSHLLEKFAPEQATEVLRVIAETEKWSFTEAFVEEMARDELAGKDGRIAPVEIQVLAQIMSRVPSEDNRRFDKTALQKLGGVDGLRGRFLQESLKVVIGKLEQDRALKVLLALTDLDQNVRSKPLSIEQLQGMTEKMQGSPSDIAATVNWLLDARLISPGDGDGTVVYELAHERLIPALRQVANKELTAANRANLLLDRRVNEWLGSGKSGRYLFSLKELWLLREQRGFLEWGERRSQKEALVKRSWGRSQRGLGVLGAPILLGSIFGIWSHMPEGQIQWTRWHLDTLKAMNISPSETTIYQDLNQSFNLDSVSRISKNDRLNSLSQQANFQNISEISKIINSIKNEDLDKKFLHQLELDSKNTYDLISYIQISSQISQIQIKLGESDKAFVRLQNNLNLIKKLHTYEIDSAIQFTLAASSEMTDQSQRAQILFKSIELIKTIQKDEQWKYSSIRSIMYSLHTISSLETKNTILYQTLEDLKGWKDNRLRAESLILVSNAFGDINNKQKEREALLQILEFYSPVSENDSWILISGVYRKLGKIKELKSTLIEAEKYLYSGNFKAPIFPSISPRSKPNYLISIAEQYIEAGELRKGEEILSKSVDLCQEINVDKSVEARAEKGSCLISIMEMYQKTRNEVAKEKIFLVVLETIKSFQDLKVKHSFLQSILKSHQSIVDPARKERVFLQLLNAVNSIQERSDRISTIILISKDLYNIKDRKNARRIMNQSLEILKLTEPPYLQAEYVSLILMKLVEIENKEDAKYILSRLLEFSESIQAVSSKIDAFSSIAKSLKDFDEEKQAKYILGKAIKLNSDNSSLIMNISVISLAEASIYLQENGQGEKLLMNARANLIHGVQSQDKRIAQAYAELGNWGEALKLSQNCYNDEKFSVFARILRVNAEKNYPELRKLRRQY